ncbi:uncharacterized protein F5891DRAFT_1017038, partial [Suillus fuscotomentosus]
RCAEPSSWESGITYANGHHPEQIKHPLRRHAPLTCSCEAIALLLLLYNLSSLDEAMSSMQLGEPKQDQQHDSGRTKESRRRINIILPPPQHNAQMYGYYISEEWLYQTALSFLAKVHPDFSESKARSNARVNPTYSFRKTFHIRSLSTTYAIPPPGQIIPAECMYDNTVCVLYIFNDQPESYNYRPIQKQVDELTRFMGREPQWWVGVMSVKFYRSMYR